MAVNNGSNVCKSNGHLLGIPKYYGQAKNLFVRHCRRCPYLVTGELDVRNDQLKVRKLGAYENGGEIYRKQDEGSNGGGDLTRQSVIESANPRAPESQSMFKEAQDDAKGS